MLLESEDEIIIVEIILMANRCRNAKFNVKWYFKVKLIMLICAS